MKISLLNKLTPNWVKCFVYDLKSLNVKINPRPIFILGNQKAGTSAIAALLAELTGLSVSIDLRKEVYNPTYDRVKKGELSFTDFIKFNKLDFSRDIIKEPNLTLLYDYLKTYYPDSKLVFVVRDPRDNIRSILDRLGIPGNLSVLTQDYQQKITPAWKLIIDSQWLGLGEETYIEKLAQRWDAMSDVFLNNREQFILIRYEDFLKDKQAAINNLAQSLALSPVNNISDKINIQFQPRGKKDVTWQNFFGIDNLFQIENICNARMKQLEYSNSTK